MLNVCSSVSTVGKLCAAQRWTPQPGPSNIAQTNTNVRRNGQERLAVRPDEKSILRGINSDHGAFSATWLLRDCELYVSRPRGKRRLLEISFPPRLSRCISKWAGSHFSRRLQPWMGTNNMRTSMGGNW